MKCIVCGNYAGYQKNVCENCSNNKKLVCKDCAQSKFESQFYKYKKTNKLYKMCKDCFNKKVLCNVCNTPINKTYLKKHIEKCKQKIGSGILQNKNKNENENNSKKDTEENLFKKKD